MTTIKEAKAVLEKEGYEILAPKKVALKKEADKMYSLYVENYGNMSIVARELGTSRERVRQTLLAFYKVTGTGHRDSKETVSEIKRVYLEKDFNLLATADELGFSLTHVRNIKNAYFPELQPKVSEKEASREKERELLRELYVKHDGNIRKVAMETGKSPSSLYDKFLSFGLKGRGSCSRITSSVILKELEKQSGSKKKTADALGVSAVTIYNRLKKIRK